MQQLKFTNIAPTVPDTSNDLIKHLPPENYQVLYNASHEISLNLSGFHECYVILSYTSILQCICYIVV